MIATEQNKQTKTKKKKNKKKNPQANKKQEVPKMLDPFNYGCKLTLAQG